ncbi:MAG: DNA integrity scanning protein DisA nucleotide-binding domain protein [Verrucomicrobiota bacterium]
MDGIHIWKIAIDIAISALLLRMVLGWLVTYNRLFWLVVALLGLVCSGYLVAHFDLPFSFYLMLALAGPLLIILFLSFLPELGRIHQAISHGNIFGWKAEATFEVIRELSDALFELAQKRRGALIVIPQADSVESLLSGGEEIDARLSKTILLSIFNTKSPRHDGAVLLNRDRVVRAGAVLPLASAEGADSELGTRHLAALGLSERSDAHVIVVSEERGSVSFAKEGALKVLPSKTEEDLESSLIDYMEIGENKSKTKKSIMVSLLLWLIACGISLAGSIQIERHKIEEKRKVELALASQNKASKLVKVAISYTGKPENLFFAGETPPSECEVLLQYPENITIPEQLTLTLDISQYKASDQAHEINLSKDMVKNLPAELEITDIKPVSISLVLAEIKRLQLDVKPPEITELNESLKLVSIKLLRPQVFAEVRDLKFEQSPGLKCFPLDVSSITHAGTHRLKAKLDLPVTITLVNQKFSNEGLDIEIVVEDKNPTPEPHAEPTPLPEP